jgi:hypothetical protein
MAVKDLTRESGISDEELVSRIRAGDTYLFEIIIKQFPEKFWRAAN